MQATATQKVLEILAERGVVRPRDLDSYGIPRRHLSRMLNRGLLTRSSRGVYVLAEASVTENHTLAKVAARVPHATVCLLSALRFHDLTTQLPHEVWIAIDRKAWQPKELSMPLRIIHASGAALSEGVETHRIEGVLVRVYSPAKTVADCFKYRSKVGLDVALESLRDCWRQRRATMDELWEAARICRMTNVMRPYLESLT